MILCTINERGELHAGISIVQWVNEHNITTTSIPFRILNADPDDRSQFLDLDVANPPEIVDGLVTSALYKNGLLYKRTHTGPDNVYMLLIENGIILSPPRMFNTVRCVAMDPCGD